MVLETAKQIVTGKPVIAWGILAVAADAGATVWTGVLWLDFAALLTSGLTLFYGGKLVRDAAA